MQQQQLTKQPVLSDFDIEDLREIPVVDPIEERNEEIRSLFGDLTCLRDMMLEFNIITAQQGEQLGAVAENVSTAQVNTHEGVQELAQAEVSTIKRREFLTRAIAVLGGAGIGATGFIANPILGLGTMLAGGGLGWLATHEKTVDTLLKVVPDTEKTD